MDVVRMTGNGVPFYACPQWEGTAHGFSTRLGGVSPAPWDSLNLGAGRGDDPARVTENFHRFCAAVGADPAALVKNKQVHGDRVRPVTPADITPADASGTAEADGLITDVPGLCLTVFSADCVPVLLHDPVHRCIAAVHAGWRGAAAGIAARAVRAMIEDYGCRPEHIQAAIGPGIGPCCFETHADVPEAILRTMGPEAQPLIRPVPERPDKFRVDIKGVSRRWLLDAGLSPDHIALCQVCTACHPDQFWSHRILGGERGSMAAVIQLI